MDYMVSYYVGTDRDCQKWFDNYKSAYEYARKQWESLDKSTRENYVNNGWQTCIVDYAHLDEYGDPTGICFNYY